MLIPPEQLVDGIVRTLLESVLPSVGTPFARGQLFAVVDLLRNLRDRIEPRTDVAGAEVDSALAALDRALATLRGGEQLAATSRIEGALAAVPDGPPRERLRAVRSVVVLALETLDELPPALAHEARLPLEGYLAQQALRALTLLKPSMLAEISRG